MVTLKAFYILGNTIYYRKYIWYTFVVFMLIPKYIHFIFKALYPTMLYTNLVGCLHKLLSCLKRCASIVVKVKKGGNSVCTEQAACPLLLVSTRPHSSFLQDAVLQHSSATDKSSNICFSSELSFGD
jgi:hypothetical protein